MKYNSLLAEYQNYHVYVVGCGGTGSNLVPHLAQLVYSLKEKSTITITLIDEDIVEPGNIGRQFFIESDIGENKARVLQTRYHLAWGVDISYYPYYIRDEATLVNLLSQRQSENSYPMHPKSIPILIGCVDNHFSRRIFNQVFQQMNNLIYLDAGNSEFSGQVVMGLRLNGETLMKPIAELDPTVLTTEDEISVGGTCGRNVVQEPQNILANMWAAATLLTYVNNIIGVGKVPAYMATFNTVNVMVRPEYLTG